MFPILAEYILPDYRWEECDAAGCMVDVLISLAVVMTLKQVLNNMREMGFV